MAEGTIGGTPISDLPPSSFAYCEPGSEAVSTRCHFPIRDKNGKADPAHVRNALARLSGSPFEAKARPKVEAAAKECGVGMPAGKALLPIKAEELADDDLDAWFRGKRARRLLAIPFGGPIPSPNAPKGVDLDGEWFSERTDLVGGFRALAQSRERLVDWHHAADPTGIMGKALIGRAELDDEPEEDGLWADFWFTKGQERIAKIKALAKRGAALFGSSQAAFKKADPETGEILVWPYYLQTITTSPQNTYSVIRPGKAVLDDAETAGIAISSAMRELLADMRSLEPSLGGPSLAGDQWAKAGRELSGANEQELTEALEAFAAGNSRLMALLDRIRSKYRKEATPSG